MRDMIIVLGVAADHVTEKSMIRTSIATFVDFWICEFEVSDGADMYLIKPSGVYSLWLSSCTYPVEMAGRWVFGQAAGTDPETVGRLLHTSLATL